MFNSFQLNPIQSQKQFHVMVDNSRSAQQAYTPKIYEHQQVEDQHYFYPPYNKSHKQSYVNQQLKLDLNNNYQKQNYYRQNPNYPINHTQQPLFLNNNHSIQHQMATLKNKYQAALLENSQLIMAIEAKNQQIEQIIKQQRQRFHMLEQKFEQAHMDYTRTVTHLENNIKNMEQNIYNKECYDAKFIQSENRNHQLMRELDQLKIQYNHKVNQLENRIRSISPFDKRHTIQYPNNNHKPYLPTYQPINRQIPIYTYNTSNAEIEKYKHDLQFYMEKVQDYDRRIKTLEQVNQGLNLQLKHVLQDRSKSKSVLSNATNNYDLQTQVTQLRNQMSQLKTLTYNQSNLTIPIHSPIQITQTLISSPNQNSYMNVRSPKPANNQKSSVRVANHHISPLKNNNNFTYESNKGNKWVEIQQRIGQLQHQNFKLKKKLHYNK